MGRGVVFSYLHEICFSYFLVWLLAWSARAPIELMNFSCLLRLQSKSVCFAPFFLFLQSNITLETPLEIMDWSNFCTHHTRTPLGFSFKFRNDALEIFKGKKLCSHNNHNKVCADGLLGDKRGKKVFQRSPPLLLWGWIFDIKHFIGATDAPSLSCIVDQLS